MLRPAEMKGFRAIIPQSTRDEVLSSLHKVGVAHLREVTLEELEKEELEEEFYEINSALGRLEEVQDFFQTTDLEVEEGQGESFELSLESARDLLEEVEPKRRELASDLRKIEEKEDDLSAKEEILSELSEVDIPLKYLQSTENIEITVGKINEEEIDEFLEVIQEALPNQVFAAAYGKGGTRIIVLACRKEVVSELRPIQYRFGVESLDLPRSDKTPTEFLEDIEEKLEKLQKKKEKVEKEIEDFKEEKGQKINALTEYLEIARESHECLPLFGRTDSTTVIEGWTPEEEIDKAEEAIREGSDDAYLMRTYDPSESEIAETPVKLDNPGGTDNFEYITEMYGLPRYDSTDPTIMVAISFSVFWGFTLSDGGYGLAILVIFLAGLSFVKDMFSKRLRKVIIAGSVCTIIIGFLFGSWFGAILGKNIAIFSPHWIDPVNNPIPFLKLVIFIGIIQLVIGYSIGAVRKHIIRRDWRKLVLNDVGNALFAMGLFLLIFCVVGTTGKGIGLIEFGINYYFPGIENIFNVFIPFSTDYLSVSIFQMIFYSGFVLKIIGSVTDPDAGGLEIVGGVINTFYGIVDLISTAVSYTRLLALGVATSVIAFVVNFIGRMLFDIIYPASFSGPLSYGLGAISVVVLAVILVGGHGFNLFINSITGFVHTMRLHYAEFFQTFYEAGGKEYSPLILIRKYTESPME